MEKRALYIATAVVLGCLWTAADGRMRGNTFTPNTDRYNYLDTELLEVLSRNGEENILVSPLGMKLILTMLMEGAEGDSAAEIRDALRLPVDEKLARNELQQKLTSLEMRKDSDVLKIASGIFVSDKFEIHPQYRAVLNDYRCDVQQFPSGNPGALVEALNAWVRGRTNGLIGELGSRTAADVPAVLANVIYFKGKWQRPFLPEKTRLKCFHTARGKCIQVPMMEDTGTYLYGYISSLDAEVIDLPYEGGRYSMRVILPTNREGMRHLTRDLLHVSLEGITDHMQEQEVHVQIPRFSLETSTEMIPVLEHLHISRVFHSGANLSGISPSDNSNLVVGSVIHSAKMIVDETGTEAVAATGAFFIPLMGGANVAFIADHPFLVFLRDSVTGSILFSGKIEKPASGVPAGEAQLPPILPLFQLRIPQQQSDFRGSNGRDFLPASTEVSNGGLSPYDLRRPLMRRRLEWNPAANGGRRAFYSDPISFYRPGY